MLLAQKLYKNPGQYCEAFNFGPSSQNNKKVEDVINAVIKQWPGVWEVYKEDENLHEANLLNLQSDKSYKILNWETKWGFDRTIYETINWYRDIHNGENEFSKCEENIIKYIEKN